MALVVNEWSRRRRGSGMPLPFLTRLCPSCASPLRDTRATACRSVLKMHRVSPPNLRRIFNELFDTFADSSDKKPAALREEMGVEDDKAAGAAAAFDAARALVAEIGKRQMAAKRQRQG